jgi:hypothetical protein
MSTAHSADMTELQPVAGQLVCVATPQLDGGEPILALYVIAERNPATARYKDYKITFAWIEGNLFNGRRVTQNVPIVTNLRQDPFERFHIESGAYETWWAVKLWTLIPAQALVADFLKSFQEFPPSQKSGSFDVSAFLEALQSGAAGAGH